MKASKPFSFPRFAIGLTLMLSLAMFLPTGVNAKSASLEPAVRELVQPHCGRCHDSRLETAKPAALKVFDLKEEKWTASMSNAQLEKINGRFENVDVTPAQRKQVAEFIKSKLKERVP